MARAGKGGQVRFQFGHFRAHDEFAVGKHGVHAAADLGFENGELAYPVAEITVAGNLIDIYSRLVPGADLEIRGSANAPSLLVDGLAIAGR